MAKLRGVLFDKDGTLFDFQKSWGAWALLFIGELADGDHSLMSRLGDAIGFDISSARFHPDSPVIAGTPGQIVSLLLPHLPGMAPAALLAHMNAAAAETPMVPVLPLAPLLDGLARKGFRLGVATNDAEAPARAHLRAAGIDSCLEFIAGCDSGFGAKPGAGQVLAFASHVGLSPGEVVMVGDSRHDLAAGRAAETMAVGVLTGPAGEDELSDLADAVLPDIGHLPGWLAGL